MRQRLNPFQQILTRCAEAILHVAGQRGLSSAVSNEPIQAPELEAEPVRKPLAPESHFERSQPSVAKPIEPPILEQPSAARVAGRPLSPALSKAVALLEKKPDLTAADLAKAVKVSKDYGRTLLKRAKARIAELEATATVLPQPQTAAFEPVAVDEALPSTGGDFQTAFDELRRSLTETQQQVQQLVATPPPAIRPGMNLNRRAQVLKMYGKGVAAKEIAAQLAINVGEVEFILKVNQMILERY